MTLPFSRTKEFGPPSDGAEPVGNDEGRASGSKLFNLLLDEFLALHVQGAVASSSTRIGAFFRKALARETRAAGRRKALPPISPIMRE